MSKFTNIIHKAQLKFRGVPDPAKNNLCAYPFIQVLLTAEGRYRPCCKFNGYITNQGETLQAGRASLNDAWNSDTMKNLRGKMLQNERDPGCAECWKEEKLGIRSMRYDSFYYPVNAEQLKHTKQPLRLEINASNVCNLKCRICSSWASTKWIREESELYGYSEEKHDNLTLQNMDEIKAWLPHLVEIGFFGGEPLLSEENLELMRYCIQSGHARHLTLLINTNTTVYSDEIAGMLKKFKKVYLNFSVDDIGKRFEYQRKGARWAESVDVIKSYLKYGSVSERSQLVCKINCTINNMNIYYMPEYFEFLNAHFPGLQVYWNLLYNPQAYCIHLLPDPVKSIIRSRLENEVKTTYTTDENKTRTIRSLISYLEHKENGRFEDFFYLIDKHDQYRKEKFAEIFPEYWNLIKSYHPSSQVASLK